MFNFETELAKYNLNCEKYEQLLQDIDSKINGESDYDWSELRDKYDVNCNPDTIRKGSTTIFGGKFRTEYFKNKELTKEPSDELEKKIEELRKERIKLQTLNIERSRIDRAEARQEMYYEYVGQIVKTLPVPEHISFFSNQNSVLNEKSYILTIADPHYGATFVSENNEYSKEIAKERFNILLKETIQFVTQHNLSSIQCVMLGDSLQGLIHLSDLKINDSSVVSSCVEFAHIIAEFLNRLSQYVNIRYYHVPSANHTQTRSLGTKANELMDEDLEYLIGHYIKDLLANNSRIIVTLANEGKQYINIPIIDSDIHILAMHGHQIKNMDNALKDLSAITQVSIDYLVLGHYHSAKNIPCVEKGNYDTEVLVSPSFVGSDPYSNSIYKGSKAACMIYGFDKKFGHTETYKIILN